ncbi:hypothetical protein ABPG74_005372 [Tetrahymena malaccensis]
MQIHIKNKFLLGILTILFVSIKCQVVLFSNYNCIYGKLGAQVTLCGFGPQSSLSQAHNCPLYGFVSNGSNKLNLQFNLQEDFSSMQFTGYVVITGQQNSYQYTLTTENNVFTSTSKMSIPDLLCTSQYRQSFSISTTLTVATNQINFQLSVVGQQAQLEFGNLKVTGILKLQSCGIIGCQVCLDSQNCQSCKASYNLISSNGQQICQLFCNEGWFVYKPYGTTQAYTFCLSCIPNCKTCSDTQSCSQCFQGYYFNKLQQICQQIPTCLSNQYLSSNYACLNCQSNCAQCSNGTSCSTCVSGYTNTLSPNQCVPITCASNQYRDSSQLCQNCTSNCLQCQNNISCDSCSNGYTQISQAPYCQSICASNQYVDQFSQCKNCDPSCNTCVGPKNSDCSSCIAGCKYPPIYRYMQLFFQFSFHIETCDQTGILQFYEPLDVSVNCQTLPQLNQSIIQMKTQQIEVDINKYQLPQNSAFDLKLVQNDPSIKITQNNVIKPSIKKLNNLNNQNTNILNNTYIYKFPNAAQSNNTQSCIQQDQDTWSSNSCQTNNFTEINGYYCYFWTLLLLTVLQVGLYSYGLTLDKILRFSGIGQKIDTNKIIPITESHNNLQQNNLLNKEIEHQLNTNEDNIPKQNDIQNVSINPIQEQKEIQKEEKDQNLRKKKGRRHRQIVSKAKSQSLKSDMLTQKEILTNQPDSNQQIQDQLIFKESKLLHEEIIQSLPEEADEKINFQQKQNILSQLNQESERKNLNEEEQQKSDEESQGSPQIFKEQNQQEELCQHQQLFPFFSYTIIQYYLLQAERVQVNQITDCYIFQSYQEQILYS